jgi:hypothetical protein
MRSLRVAVQFTDHGILSGETPRLQGAAFDGAAWFAFVGHAALNFAVEAVP